jgi:hypothetical protein
MPEFRYIVKSTTDTQEHADQVIQERTGFDEQLEDEDGNDFDYSISYDIAP